MDSERHQSTQETAVQTAGVVLAVMKAHAPCGEEAKTRRAAGGREWRMEWADREKVARSSFMLFCGVF
jgi:hypothetical protein